MPRPPSRAGTRALEAPQLKRAFITHLHSDHTLGLADLILSPWVLERDAPLEIYGPRGLRSMTDHLVAAYAEDIRVRRSGGEPAHKYDPRHGRLSMKSSRASSTETTA